VSKDDVDVPDEVPSKRRQLEGALDKWLAVWLTRDDLTPSQRRRLEEEKARRKALVPDQRVGVLVGAEGCTREQRARIMDVVAALQPTEIHHPGLSSPMHQACRRVAPVVVHQDGIRPAGTRDMQDVVKAAHVVVGAVRSRSPEGTPVWEMIRYAKHRSLPVRVVLPDGSELQGEVDG
jgi:hypothetical protein